jgi:predicted RNA-binding protein YlqC (UPF0109 family)
MKTVEDVDAIASSSDAALALITTTTADLTIDGDDGDDEDANNARNNGNDEAPSAAEATDVISYTPNHWIEERDELSRLYVGRIIGKGGEMIRDLQARSGCRIDIHQDVTDVNEPRIICYRGLRQEDIELARHLVAMLCSRDMPLSRGGSSASDGGAGVDSGYDDGGGNSQSDWRQYGPAMHSGLPLGRAVMRQVYVPNSVVGRIIGRGGEVIRDLQSKSRARIQIDHNPPDDERTDNHYRRITITGTEEAACRAEDLLLRVSNTAIAADSKGQSGAMPTSMVYPSYASVNQYVPHPDSPTNTIKTHRTLIKTETLPIDKSMIGHVIGRHGSTINDLQRRSACNIQVDQLNSIIYVTGPQLGIDIAMMMIDEIFQCGPNHSFAGGRQQQVQHGGGVLHPNDARHLQESQLYGDYHSRSGSFSESIQSNSVGPTPSPYHGYIIAYPTSPSQQPMVQVQQPQQQHPLPYSPQEIHQHLSNDDLIPQQVIMSVNSPWIVGTSPEGRMYYYNVNTLESRWDKPIEM